MRKKTNGIIVTALVMLAFIACIGTKKNVNNADNTDKLIVDNEIVLDHDEINYEISIETIHQNMVAGTVINKSTEEETEEEIRTDVPTEAPTVPPTETPTEAPVIPPTEAPIVPPTEAPVILPTEAPTEAVVENKTWKYVLVGDSRMVGMQQEAIRTGTVKPNMTFICEGGEGYNYLNSNLAYIQSLCDSSTILVVALGVNDMGNLNSYISLLNAMADWDCRIYYSLVTPVNEEKELASTGSLKITNAAIDSFNANMMIGLDKRIGIIDLSSYMKTFIADPSTTNMDGIHYQARIYLNVYNYLIGFLP